MPSYAMCVNTVYRCKTSYSQHILPPGLDDDIRFWTIHCFYTRSRYTVSTQRSRHGILLYILFWSENTYCDNNLSLNRSSGCCIVLATSPSSLAKTTLRTPIKKPYFLRPRPRARRRVVRCLLADRSDVPMCPPMIVCWIALYTGFHFALSPWPWVPSC